MKIDVLTFAHLAEAHSFIDGLGLKKDENFPNVYVEEGLSLLITGQGMDNVDIALNKLLELHKNNVNRVFNFGIAGKLDQLLTLDKVYPINTVFSADGKSFNINRDRGVNCVTSPITVNDENTAWELAQLGQVVDMELYAVARIASEHNIHLSAYKVISDNAAKEVDLKELISKSKLFSELLYTYYIDNYRQN